MLKKEIQIILIGRPEAKIIVIDQIQADIFSLLKARKNQNINVMSLRLVIITEHLFIKIQSGKIFFRYLVLFKLKILYRVKIKVVKPNFQKH